MSNPTLVVIESPYAGEVERNLAYARAAMRDSILRGEAPIASHLLYTQRGILDDNDPIERATGIEAGLVWSRHAEKAVFYIDLGWSGGMTAARSRHLDEGREIEERSLPEWDALRATLEHQAHSLELFRAAWRETEGKDFSHRLARNSLRAAAPELAQIMAEESEL